MPAVQMIWLPEPTAVEKTNEAPELVWEEIGEGR
jgi:hypothetical protein